MNEDELYRLYVITYARVKSGGVINLSEYLHLSSPELFHTLRAQVTVALATDDAAGKTGLCNKLSVVTRVAELLGQTPG